MQLIPLFDGKNEMYVKKVQSILREHGIESVHFSSSFHKRPRPTGLRVRRKDFLQAKRIYSEYLQSLPAKSSELSPMEKTQAFGCKMYLVVIILILIGVFISGMF